MNDINKNHPESNEIEQDSSSDPNKASSNLNAEIAKALAMEKLAKGETPPTENTTNDLQQEAFKAMKLEADRLRDAETQAKLADAGKSRFTASTRLKLEMQESRDLMIREVVGELVVGRADNVTDYIPEIDLTPHGAYRLGLSRRHAIILREGEQLLVKDLSSRNGTFVNGIIIPSGGTQVLRDGDELRFGNLKMRVIFDQNS